MAQRAQTRGLLRFGVFEVDTRSGELHKQGLKVKLQDQPFRVLAMLLERPGEVVTREELRQKLWPADTFVDFEDGLNTAINKLRQALGDSAENPRFVETLPRRGYRLIAQVDGLDVPVPMGGPAPVSTDSFTRRVISPSIDAIVDAHHSRTWWRGKTGLGIASLVLAALVALGTWFAAFRARGEAIDSVAVLPFVNASGDSNTEYLSDGITEGIINNLSQLPNLRVIARTTVFRYKGKEADPQKVGQDLRVRAVLSGRLVQRGDTVAVQAELVDVANGLQLWGGQYHRKAMDVFALQEDLSKEISGRLRLRLTGEEKQRLAKRYTANPEAYQDYLKGRYLWNKRTEEGFRKGIEFFQQASQKDPSYALAYSGLADCHSLLAVWDFVPAKQSYPRAKEAALKALELDDTLAEAHASLAMIKTYYDWDWSGAEKEFRRASELNPSYATAHMWYGEALGWRGRLEEAIAEEKRALELDPLSLIISLVVADQFYLAREYDQAIEQYRKTLELDPNFMPAHWALGGAYLQKSMYKEATTEFEEALVISPGNTLALAGLGHAYGVAGRRAGAQKVLEQLSELSKQEYISAVYRATIYVGLGEKNKAFEWLEKAYEDRSIGGVVYGIKVDPVYDPLRSDPRFADLVRRVGLPP